MVLAVLVLLMLAAPAYGIVRALGLFDEAPQGDREALVYPVRPEKQERPGIPRELKVPARPIVDIRTHDGGRAAISIRPAEEGGLCWSMEQRDGSGARAGATRCRFRENQPEETHPFDLLLLSADVQLIGGEVPPHVKSLELRFADGTSTSISVVKNFFVYEVPESHQAPESRPLSLLARNGAGVEVGETGFCWDDLPRSAGHSSVFCPG